MRKTDESELNSVNLKCERSDSFETFLNLFFSSKDFEFSLQDTNSKHKF